MTGLKTLKDIPCIGKPTSQMRWYRVDLERVAREWIKDLDKACEDLESDNEWIELMIRETSHRGDWGRDVLSRWIKHFFNLEDE